MRRAAHSTIYDSLRQPLGLNGAIKSPSPQSEKPIADQSFRAGMDTSGIGQSATTARGSRTYAGGALTPQLFGKPPAGANSDESLMKAPVAMNARAAYPGRGITPRRSPMATRQ